MIVDLFAGPGGWSEGLRMLSPAMHNLEVGLEWDALACATRAAAGHRTIRTDVAAYPTDPFIGAIGLIASPPCQDFSAAGKNHGIDGARGQLITEVIRWAEALRPEWIACEQVPPAIPIWRDYATILEGLGYSTWVGVLIAADYGVAQVRRRAILIASRTRAVQPPTPTHAKNPEASLIDADRRPWTTMLEATGFGGEVNTGCYTNGLGRHAALAFDASISPATTLTAKAGGQWHLHEGDGHRMISIPESLGLQSFPPDYPVAGKRTKQLQQIGNAVPPRLAAHVLAAAIGMDPPPG